MDITVNGEPAAVTPDPDASAAGLIREGLGLTGTKVACGQGVCGACTVLVDGDPAASCLLPCSALEGRSVTTVEGLGGDHPVQRAFAAHDALQCGFCTPGFVVEAAAFTDRWRAEHGDAAPGRAEIADALAGHLCRCGAYQGIYEAVAAACTGAFDEDTGAEPARAEAVEKVTGRARYATDAYPEGYWEAVVVRSPVPHARVRGVDTGALEGLGAVHTDLLGEDRTVRYTGRPVLAVAAPTRAAARAAADAVRIDYEELPAVLDTDQAGKPDAPLVYPGPESRRAAPSSNEGITAPARWQGNVRGPAGLGFRRGTAVRRINEAHARGDRRLFAAEFSTAVQVHTPLEPHACVARWEGGELHIEASTQTVDGLARAAAERWGLPVERVHVRAHHVGGGFGAKSGLGLETVAAVELARLAGAPVRLVFGRAEELTDAGNRPGTRTRVAVLADADGGLSALTVDTWGDGGVSIGSGAAAMAMLVYGRAPRRVRDYDVVTNRPPGLPFRGPGGAPLAWALEQAVDEVADRLGEDPIALRRRWDGNPKRRALYDVAAALPLWRDRPRGPQTGRFRRGVGVSASNWPYLLDPSAQVELVVEDGRVVARTATQDIGTGVRTVIARVVREELGLEADQVEVETGDSGPVPGPGSFGSRTTTSVGPAAREAARSLAAELGRRGAGGVPVSREALKSAEGLRATGRRARDRYGFLTPAVSGGVVAIGRGLAGALHVMEVEVDTLLGSVRPLRCWAGVASGRIYAERPARNQAEGGVVQGIGYALFEQRITDPATGAVLTENLEDYRLPGIGDVPDIEVHFHQEGWEHVPGGGVGLGEVTTVGVAASVANAVRAATGWRPLALPITPARLLEGIG
ncbi:molybdopterin-dependent oxidoreductase [Nocardiopsis composta]|uniref:Xanthine dehydrogenase YagR molybdenum-binding subunit n=1 Tax=Nocardiopsis composta TaxID=157465 RepID=A0A7W8QI98_9ACTN|nr:molybdopterin-dependent oxidoreductase [Nocardiopsis composta]MBB5430790.1 xanthine dehydrogenase YagR molybdenum-binding subunit [Nocardiopsis composta]